MFCPARASAPSRRVIRKGWRHGEKRRAWIVLIVAVVLIASLTVAYYLGFLGNVAVEAHASVHDWNEIVGMGQR